MEVITITSEAFQEIINNISEISKRIDKANKQNPLSEVWLDTSDAAMLLKISKRTLQNYRDTGIIGFSQIGGKVYFKASDIEEHLSKHYNKAIKK
ncbi:MAG TPA: helix-turn-helix domain-containing protein [Bacteroidales bacterium]|nr:helix-turn-helix domain-containing protein [Bacteroidales bacterium]HPS16896.1 helix-turn-helix domain-containing protein [Bacteroidales bacterium]